MDDKIMSHVMRTLTDLTTKVETPESRLEDPRILEKYMMALAGYAGGVLGSYWPYPTARAAYRSLVIDSFDNGVAISDRLAKKQAAEGGS